MSDIFSPGLDNIIAGETAVSTLADGLAYRGYPVIELTEHCAFEEVAFLLLHGDLPKLAELAAFRSRLVAAAQLPEAISHWISKFPPAAPPMDLVRSAVSLLAHVDPEANDPSQAANLRKSERLVARIPTILGWIAALRGGTSVLPQPELGFAENLLWEVTTREPDEFARKAFDVSLILYAEHEFNASTFATRVVASTGSDIYSAITAAIGALKGPLHGGANERVVDVLTAAGAPEQAEAWMLGALARKDLIMGFGHRIYKAGDVRATVLKPYAREALARAGMSKLEQTSEVLETVMAREKNLHPNLDWPAGRLYHALGLEIPFYTPFFVAARVAGWCAHFMEQRANNRLIRPKSRYIGPGRRAVVEIAKR